jgi:5-methylcytosine-specific restriction endonuclease McrA
MLGKIKRKRIEQTQQARWSEPPLICPLCDRFIPESQKDAHHLVPKSKGGKATEYLHRICHRQIHGLLTETELARNYNTVDALRAHAEMAKFIAWVKTKPDDFMQRVSKSSRLKRR